MPGRASSPAFVGRAEELGVLRSALSQAADGHPSAVLVAGEAGVGKSRLVAELAAQIAPGEATVLFGHCVEVGDGELPYAPVVGALRALAAQLDPDELEDVIGPGRAELARLVPDLGTPAGPLAEVGQARLFELLLGSLGRRGRRAPVALVVEDLQWADRS